jgi:DNA-binding SARP family transcriptional activator
VTYWCRTIGELALYRDPGEQKTVVRSGKSLALLAYLGLTPSRSEARDRIAELLWPRSTPARAHADLRQALYRLREATEGVPLAELDDGTVGVIEGRLKFDCVEGEQALAAGDLERACTLLRGTFLDRFTIPNATEFESWAEAQRERFRECYRRSASALVERLLAAGRPGDAIPLAEELVQTNPLDEHRVRLLMMTLERAGREREAIGQYRALETLLRKEVDDAPSKDLRHYANELDRSLAAVTAATPGPVSAHRVRPLHYVLAAGIGLAMIAVLVRPLFFERNPYAVGTIYLESPAPNGDVAAWSRVQWPRQGQLQRTASLQNWPALLAPRVTSVSVRSANDTRRNLVRINGRDTIPLTSGPYDDNDPQWSPDGRWIAFTRGWRVGAQYRQNIFITDAVGRRVRQVTTAEAQDRLLDWSRDGSRLLFARVRDGGFELWLGDVDGVREQSLMDLLPDTAGRQWKASFAPDGRMVAAIRDDGAIFLVHLEDRTVERLSVACHQEASRPTWSPDGRYLALTCIASGARLLSVLSPGGDRRLWPVSDLPAGAQVLVWYGDPSAYADRIRLDSHSIKLPSGTGRPIAVAIEDQLGRPISAPVRWSVGDSLVARIDSTGFLVGRQSGHTQVIASIGGFRADTALVTITAARTDTLLTEEWSTGIDTARWRTLGFPRPATVPHAGPTGGPAFLSNGDYNWPSGVVSIQEFDLHDGLTVEVDGRFTMTGAHWQEFEFALVPHSLAIENGERNIMGWLAGWVVIGPSPEYAAPFYACGSQVARSPPRGTWTMAEANRGWHHFVIQVRPDARVECFVDGRLHGSFEIPQSHRVPAAAVMLGGRSNQTRIYHGPVLATRGLRY